MRSAGRLSVIVFTSTLLVTGCGGVNFSTGSFGEGVKGSGKQTTEARNVSGFSSVELAGEGEVTLEQGPTESLTITADDNLLPYITSDVNGKELRLGTKDNTNIRPSSRVIYKLSFRDINEIKLTGSGSMSGKGIKANSLNLVIAGSGDISAEGMADRMELFIAGSGNYNGDGLKSKEAKVQIMGSGNADLAANDKLDVTIGGSGSVQYSGNPVVTMKSLGSGTVSKKR